jgi:RNA recognition motif
MVGEEPPAENVLNLTNLPTSIREQEIRELLSPYGKVVHVRITVEQPSTREFVRKSSSARVIFEKAHQAEKAHTTVDGDYLSEGWRVKASWGDAETKRASLCSSADRSERCVVSAVQRCCVDSTID